MSPGRAQPARNRRRGACLPHRAAYEGLTNPNFKALIENSTHNGACAAAQCCQGQRRKTSPLVAAEDDLSICSLLRLHSGRASPASFCVASLGTTSRRHAVEATSSAQVLEKRDPYRAGHLGLIKEMAAEGRVLSAGAFTDPVDGAMFVFTDR